MTLAEDRITTETTGHPNLKYNEKMGFDVLLGFLLNHEKIKNKNNFFISFYSTFQGCVVLLNLSVVYTENAMFGLHIKTKRNRTKNNLPSFVFLRFRF